MTKRTSSLAAAIAMLSMTLAAPALAQRDNVIAEARAAGLVGEQTDGYLGFVSGAQISADLRGRVEQNNMRRRAAYTERAAAANASVAEIAAAVACEVFQDPQRLRVGERYRDDAGQWRQHTASQAVNVPAVCN
ncbi:MAG: DUF1318 domain-containing protein [Terricaulis sp.]